jgi:glycosyl-4,4'-diaponeurosporenoate acyltransferase
MLVEFSNTQIILANCLGIPLAHLGLSWLVEQLPRSLFEKDLPPSSNRSHSLYRRVFFIHRWKHLLPDAAPWVSGFPKARLTSDDPSYLRTFIAETRRGELAHWLQWLVISSFIIWNPFPANLIILIYAVVLNLPCILNLRHTRQRLSRLLLRRAPSEK